jgi:hypothetical protein
MYLVISKTSEGIDVFETESKKVADLWFKQEKINCKLANSSGEIDDYTITLLSLDNYGKATTLNVKLT